jgi:hypothetical protein
VVGLLGLGSFGKWRQTALSGVALAVGLSAACGRSQSNAPVDGTGGNGGEQLGAGTGSTGTGGRAGTGGTGRGGTGTGGTGKGGAGTIAEGGMAGSPSACTPSARVAPMRQLTRFQFNNVLRDVLGDDGRRAQRLPQNDLDADLAIDGTANAEWVTELHGLAHDFAVASTASNAALSATLGCDVEADGEAVCKARLFEHILPRLFRRPLEAADLDQFEALLATGAELGGDGFASSVRMALEVALQSPELVYRTELGEPLDVPSSDPRSGWSRPTPFEMASRLSFLLWGSAPDDALLAEAAAGGLRTQDEVRAAALRLLKDERATALIRYVHLRLLRLFDRPLPVEDWGDYTEKVHLLMQLETAAFLDDVSSTGAGGFELLLTAPYTYLNEDLAAFYGIPDVVGPELRKVSLAASAHSGILTQGSFLTANSWAGGTDPSRRGRAILEAFLCTEVSALPEGNLHHVLPPASDGLTTRERFTQLTQSDPVCTACHYVVNPPGFALEHFDHVGRYRDTEADKPIDAEVEIQIDGATHAVNGAADLGRLLAGSPEARACYLRHWAAYAYTASTDAPLDECSRAQLADVFERTDGDLRAFLLELTQTNAFLYLSPGVP